MGLRESRAGDFLFRYLRTLVAWQQAVRLFVVASRLHISPLRVCYITTIKSNILNEGLSFLDSAKRILENNKFDSDKCHAAQSWVEEQLERNPAPAPVHAEAGLMALVYNVYQGRVDTDSAKSYFCALKVCFHSFCLIPLSSFLQPLGSLANHIPIGLIKKCCALCHRLADLIQKEMPHTSKLCFYY